MLLFILVISNLIFAGLTVALLLDARNPEPAADEPTLYRYEIDRTGFPKATVYAADANTDDIDTGTVHFLDHEGMAIAIYYHVREVVGRKVVSDED